MLTEEQNKHKYKNSIIIKEIDKPITRKGQGGTIVNRF